MENRDTYFSDLKQDLKSYITDNILLVKLKSIRSASAFGGMLVVMVAAALLLFFTLLFFGLTAGFFLSDLLNSRVAGFAIVAVVFILFIVCALTLKRRLIAAWVNKKLIRHILGDQTQEEMHARTEHV